MGTDKKPKEFSTEGNLKKSFKVKVLPTQVGVLVAKKSRKRVAKKRGKVSRTFYQGSISSNVSLQYENLEQPPHFLFLILKQANPPMF